MKLAAGIIAFFVMSLAPAQARIVMIGPDPAAADRLARQLQLRPPDYYRARGWELIRLLPWKAEGRFVVIEGVGRPDGADLTLREFPKGPVQSYPLSREQFMRLRKAASEFPEGEGRAEEAAAEICLYIPTAQLQMVLGGRKKYEVITACDYRSGMSRYLAKFALSLDTPCKNISNDLDEALHACLHLGGDHALAARGWQAALDLEWIVRANRQLPDDITRQLAKIVQRDVRLFSEEGKLIRGVDAAWVGAWQDRSPNDHIRCEPAQATAQDRTATVTGDLVLTTDSHESPEKRAAFTQTWLAAADGRVELREFHLGEFK